MLNKKYALTDTLGITASVACILHCMLSPIAMAFLPYYLGHAWSNELTHQILALIAVVLCLFSMKTSCLSGNKVKAIMPFVIGGMLLIFAAFILPERLHNVYEVYILSCASLCLVGGHISNIRRLCRCSSETAVP